MARFERILDETGEVLDVREYLDGEALPDLTHKGCSWREIVPAMVVRVALPDRAVVLPQAAERIRYVYRDRIVDAMPNGEEVSRLCAERDAKIAALNNATLHEVIAATEIKRGA